MAGARHGSTAWSTCPPSFPRRGHGAQCAPARGQSRWPGAVRRRSPAGQQHEAEPAGSPDPSLGATASDWRLARPARGVVPGRAARAARPAWPARLMVQPAFGVRPAGPPARRVVRRAFNVTSLRSPLGSPRTAAARSVPRRSPCGMRDSRPRLRRLVPARAMLVASSFVARWDSDDDRLAPRLPLDIAVHPYLPSLWTRLPVPAPSLA
jgi:hypothetical protein